MHEHVVRHPTSDGIHLGCAVDECLFDGLPGPVVPHTAEAGGVDGAVHAEEERRRRGGSWEPAIETRELRVVVAFDEDEVVDCDRSDADVPIARSRQRSR